MGVCSPNDDGKTRKSAQHVVDRRDRLADVEAAHRRAKAVISDFQAGEVHAGTDVSADPEPKMIVRLPSDVEFFRPFPFALVAIGGSIGHKHARPCGQQRAIELRVL